MANEFVNGLSCEAPEVLASDVTFEQAREAYGRRSFWVTFFVRPCCPPPSGAVAKRELDKQRNLVRSHPGFSDEQKAELIGLIDEGERWYRSTPYWTKGA